MHPLIANSPARTSLSLLHLLRYASTINIDLETKPPTFQCRRVMARQRKISASINSCAIHLPTLASISQIPFAQRPNHYNATLTKIARSFSSKSHKLVRIYAKVGNYIVGNRLVKEFVEVSPKLPHLPFHLPRHAANRRVAHQISSYRLFFRMDSQQRGRVTAAIGIGWGRHLIDRSR
jgi:hypothetical protein